MAQGAQVLVERGVAYAHRIDRHMGSAERLPVQQVLAPGVLWLELERQPRLDAERLALAPGGAARGAQALDLRAGDVIGRALRHPAVAEAGDAAERGVGLAADVDGDVAARRQWIQPGVLDG